MIGLWSDAVSIASFGTMVVMCVVETNEGTTSPWGGFLVLKWCIFSGKGGCSDRDMASRPHQISYCSAICFILFPSITQASCRTLTLFSVGDCALIFWIQSRFRQTSLRARKKNNSRKIYMYILSTGIKLHLTIWSGTGRVQCSDREEDGCKIIPFLQRHLQGGTPYGDCRGTWGGLVDWDPYLLKNPQIHRLYTIIFRSKYDCRYKAKRIGLSMNISR